MPTGPFLGEHAIVIGGSVSGILAARVLSDHFERVSVVERDFLNARPIGRKGTPQARHFHLLLAAGAAVVRDLFPELAADMPAAGALPVDSAKDLRWFHFGVWKARVESGITLYLCNRMVLETAMRAELRRRANVEIVDDCDVVGLICEDQRITGIRCQRKGQEEGEAEALHADLVVDASGRGTRSPRWLADVGLPRVRESEVRVNVGYASRVYRMPRSFPSERLPLAVFPKPPESGRLGVMVSVDGGVLMVTLGGVCRDYPPTNNEGFVEFARSLPIDEFSILLNEAKPAPAIHGYQVPSNLRRHYDRMPGYPDGYLVVGDALCSFNPIYGQGMSAAALQVQAIQRALGRLRASGRSLRARGLGRRIQRQVARTLSLPWLLATAEDFRFAGVTGPRPFGLPIIQWYVSHILQLSATHPEIARRFVRVLNLLAGPTILFTPSIVFAVLWHTIRGRPNARLAMRGPLGEPPLPDLRPLADDEGEHLETGERPSA